MYQSSRSIPTFPSDSIFFFGIPIMKAARSLTKKLVYLQRPKITGGISRIRSSSCSLWIFLSQELSARWDHTFIHFKLDLFYIVRRSLNKVMNCRSWWLQCTIPTALMSPILYSLFLFFTLIPNFWWIL